MSLKTPTWWYQKRPKAPWWRALLWPLSLLWGAVTAYKLSHARPYRSRLKVISVGNLSAGGSGKTPITHEILRILNAHNQQAVGLSRGYGGKADAPINVDFSHHAATEVGDEPLLIAEDQPFWVARDRAEGLRAIEATDAEIVVVDDAHQNTTIAIDRHILVVDGDTSGGQWPFGDGGLIPYGPLREGFKTGLERADLIVLWLPEGTVPDPDLMALLSSKPILVARLVPEALDTHLGYLAFAGIAKPWRFKTTLQTLGARLESFVEYGDHEPLTETELQRLHTEATKHQARLITTQKDWIRLSPAQRRDINHLRIRASFEDKDRLMLALNLLPPSQNPS